MSPSLLIVGLFLLAGCSLPSFLVTPITNPTGLQESVVDKGGRDKIVVVPVEGLLVNARAGGGPIGGPGENKVSLIAEQLDRAAKDKHVKAVVLRVNSPGGTVAGSDALYHLVADFRTRTGKPVVAAVQELGASGGYYVALAADEIYAQPTSLVGSVGVIIQTFDATGTMSLLGLQPRAYTSGDLKSMGSPLEERTADQDAVFEGLVDEMFDEFATKVRQRTLSTDAWDTISSGRIFTGKTAVDLGMIDGIGQLQVAIDRASQLAGVTKPTVVIYKRPFGYEGSVYAAAEPIRPMSNGSPITLPETLQPLPGGAYYLWRP